jgi:tetratricopeptide (TPR) repeat protein
MGKNVKVKPVQKDDPEELFQQARNLRIQRNYKKAQNVLDKALEQYPQNKDLLNEQGFLYYAQKKFEDAINVFDKTLKIDKNNVSTFRWKITSLRRLHQFAKAEKVADEALSHSQKNTSILMQKGRLYFEWKKYEKAIKVFDEILENKPKNVSALMWKINSFRKLLQFERAEEEAIKALNQLPNNATLLNARGLIYYDQRNYDKAIEYFDTALESDGENSYAYNMKINSFRKQHCLKEAEEEAEKALNLLPGNATLLNTRGLIYYDQRNYDKAIECFDQALKNNPKNEFSYQTKICPLRKKRQFKEAEKVAEEALANLGKKAGIITHRGLLYFDQEQFDKAEASFTEAIDSNPYLAYPYIKLIRVLIRTNKSHKTLEILQDLKQIFSTDLEVREQVGWFYIVLNDLKNAETEFKFVIEKVENNTLGTNGLGGVYFSQGRYKAAERKFLKALEIEPNNPVFHTNVARVLIQQETADFAKAENHCREALAIDSQYAPAFECLGIVAFKKGDFLEAENYLCKSTEVNPEKGSYTSLGAFYVQMGKYEEAEENLKKAVEINSNDTQAYIELGNLYLEMEKAEDALQKFRQAATVNPINEEPRRALAIALMKIGEFTEAERVLRTALTQLDGPRRWQLHLLYAQLLTDCGDKTGDNQYYEEALEEVTKAKHLNPDHPSPHFCDGVVRAKLNEYRGALKSFQSCLNKDKDNLYVEAKRNMRRIKSHSREELFHGEISAERIFVGSVSLVQLIFICIFYIMTDKISETLLALVVSLSFGFFLVALLLPWLSRVKVSEFEVEVTHPREEISSGPAGDIGFGNSPLVISSGLQ